MKPAGLQERFLNILRKEAIPATFFLVNGFQMKGVVKAFDHYTLVLEANGAQELVYKHALSTIIPSRALDLKQLAENTEEVA
jgi:host factor-I protein